MVSKTLHIGVLALQGAFAKHLEMISSLGARGTAVRFPAQLGQLDALILPGGESTTMQRQMETFHFREALLEFAAKKPVFGTCAGMILMAREEAGRTITPLGLVDIAVERNAYGRQYDSFLTKLKIQLKKSSKLYPCSFIRAPRINQCGAGVSVLATYNDAPVLVQQGRHLCSAFHPELTNDPAIHQYFFSLI